MIFEETKLPGVVEVKLERANDARGFFARSWCKREFETHGLNTDLVQCNVSFNDRKGTLRGMHYQEAPNAEAKLVRCTSGSLYDVIIDLRPKSPSFRAWVGVVVSAEEHNMIYVPEGCAHGFLTLQDNTEVFYQMSQYYSPESARGVRWNDPAFEISWPGKVEVISERDRNYADFASVSCAY